jgi:hypothetical protein
MEVQFVSGSETMEDTSAKSKPRRKTTTDDGQKPVHVISVGSLTASIYLRQAPSGYGYYAYNIKRMYRSLTTGNQIHSTDFFADSKADLIAVATQASQWIASESERPREALHNAA